jgi:hypothetical protein
MTLLIQTAILAVATLASFALAIALTRLALAAMFRLLPAARPALRVITGGRARAQARASLFTPSLPA